MRISGKKKYISTTDERYLAQNEAHFLLEHLLLLALNFSHLCKKKEEKKGESKRKYKSEIITTTTFAYLAHSKRSREWALTNEKQKRGDAAAGCHGAGGFPVGRQPRAERVHAT